MTGAPMDGEILAALACRLDAAPSRELAGVLHDELVAALGVRYAWLYLLAFTEDDLRPAQHPRDPSPPPEPIPVDGTDAGRALLARRPVRAGDVLWVPLSQRGETVGVLALGLGERHLEAERIAAALGVVVGAAVIAIRRRFDDWERARGAAELTLPAFVQWGLLAPTIHREPGFDVAARIEPAEEFGGDCWDFGVHGTTLTFGLFDATGHDLQAAGLGGLAAAAFRWARRCGQGLEDAARTIDRAVRETADPTRFVTATLCELDGTTGELRWLCAGHPPPLLLGAGGSAELTPPAVAPPFGWAGEPVAGSRTIERGDVVVLYSDGMSEAGRRRGDLFGLARLEALALGCFARGAGAHVAVRAMLDGALAHERGRLVDDATVFAARWLGPS